MIPSAPCLDCEKRTVGCHSNCERYGKFKADSEDYRSKENKERHARVLYSQTRITRIKKTR